jgi:hypothetical protein
MKLSVEERAILVSKLCQTGWRQEGGSIYAPNGTIWFTSDDPWQGDLADFHERMIGRLERINNNKDHYPDPTDHEKIVSDTEAVVVSLAETLKERGNT